MLFRAQAYAPLVPFAIAATIGIVADRFLPVLCGTWLLIAAGAIFTSLIAYRRHSPVCHVALWVCAGALAAAHHHLWQNDFAGDDIGNFAAIEPTLVRVRGTLDEEPSFRRRGKSDPLTSRPQTDRSTTVLAVTQLLVGRDWVLVSGRARLTVEGHLSHVHLGDEVEFLAWLSRPTGPLNPGELDHAALLLNQRIRAELRVQDTAEGVVRLDPGSIGLRRSLAAIRSWGQRGLSETLTDTEGPVASALLLGDGSAMTAETWERYVRTGVVHVLAISGQHLVILGAFLWFVLRVAGVRRRPAAIVIAAVLLSYALMTGGRPSAVRAAVMACAMCGAVLMSKRALAANTMAFAWLVVLMIQPTDLFTAGFQLSFLCVAVLAFGIPQWFPPRELDDHQRLIEESRSGVERAIRGVLRFIGRAYLITFVLGLATAPLIAYWQNLVSPAGLLIGPPAILFTTVALIAGFLLLFLWPLGPVALPFIWMTEISLAACESLVGTAERLPAGYWFIGPLPLWWVCSFYGLGIVWLLAGMPDRVRLIADIRRPFLFPVLIGSWTLIGVLVSLYRAPPDDLRITFLSVNHGACVVIEAPDGRVLLYDAGASAGPDVTRRQIAPFLWSRGIRRVDEVFLSHADLDHFNGLPALLDRFAVGLVTYNPTFADKRTGGVKTTTDALERRGVAVRTARAGDRFTAGTITIDVLHPPPEGPTGVENVRSLVLLIRHLGHSILLTGDLEGIGVDRLTEQPGQSVDVLMVPHHGAGGTRIESLVHWARPRIAVSSQGRGDAGKARAVYQRNGIPYWATWPEGAVTIRSHTTGLTAESFVSAQRTVVRSGVGE